MESELLENQHLILRVTDYGLKHQEFTLEEMYNQLSLNKSEREYVRNVLTQTTSVTTDNTNHIFVLFTEVAERGFTNVKMSTYTLVPNAFYNYVDYLEIKEARKSAEQAREQSSTAIWISVWALVATVALGFLQLLISMNVKL